MKKHAGKGLVILAFVLITNISKLYYMQGKHSTKAAHSVKMHNGFNYLNGENKDAF